MAPPPPPTDVLARLRSAVSRSGGDTLAEPDIATLAPFGEVVQCVRGDTLFREQQLPHSAFIVVDGEIELVYETPFERLVLQVFGPGSSLGYLAVVLSSPYAYTAVARTPATLLRFDEPTITRLIETDPSVCFRWLRLVAQNLERSQRRLVELAGKNAFERVSHFLLNRSAERRSASLELQHRDIGDALALSRQTVSRVLSLMREQGLIETSRGHVRIADVQRLRRHAPRPPGPDGAGRGHRRA
jgi:CRP/FNR family transcriptional regulator